MAILDHFWTKNFNSETTSFPKDSKSLKIFDIRLREVVAKRRLNVTSKVNIQTDRRTSWLIESIGPEGQCFRTYFSRWRFIVHVFFFSFLNKDSEDFFFFFSVLGTMYPLYHKLYLHLLKQTNKKWKNIFKT